MNFAASKNLSAGAHTSRLCSKPERSLSGVPLLCCHVSDISHPIKPPSLWATEEGREGEPQGLVCIPMFEILKNSLIGYYVVLSSIFLKRMFFDKADCVVDSSSSVESRDDRFPSRDRSSDDCVDAFDLGRLSPRPPLVLCLLSGTLSVDNLQ